MADKTMKVKHVEKISGHPVVSLLSRGQAEIGQYGCWEPTVHWEQSAFYLQLGNGEIIAALSYHKRPDRSCYWIDMGFVIPACRGEGLYRMLHEALVRRAKEKAIRTVEGEVAIENLSMMLVAEALGRVASSTRWVTKVGGL